MSISTVGRCVEKWLGAVLHDPHFSDEASEFGTAWKLTHPDTRRALAAWWVEHALQDNSAALAQYGGMHAAGTAPAQQATVGRQRVAALLTEDNPRAAVCPTAPVLGSAATGSPASTSCSSRYETGLRRPASGRRRTATARS